MAGGIWLELQPLAHADAHRRQRKAPAAVEKRQGGGAGEAGQWTHGQQTGRAPQGAAR